MAINIIKMHREMTANLHPAFSNTDKHFLAVSLGGEVGELANMIKKRWRDGVDLTAEIHDELADCRVYLALLAHCYGDQGEVCNFHALCGGDERSTMLSMFIALGRISRMVQDDVVLRMDDDAEIDRDEMIEVLKILHSYLVHMAAFFDFDIDDYDAHVQDKLRRVAEKRNLKDA